MKWHARIAPVGDPVELSKVRAAWAVAAVLWVSGCATVTESPTQTITVLAYDQRDRPIAGMQCNLTNGMGEASFSTPANRVEVRRSPFDLEIECKRGNDIAKGTVAPRRENLEQALLPFGWVGVSVDHLTGQLYSYPDLVRLRVGQHVRYEFSREARAAGVIATLHEETLTDIEASAVRTEPLPAAASAPAAKPAAKPAPKRSAQQPVAVTRTQPATATAPRTAPLTW